VSEGPEVRRAADKLAEVILGKSIVDLRCKFIMNDFKEKIIGSTVLSVDTYGKNIIFHFSSNIYLRNHMMMWGKWRIYSRTEYDSGKAKPPTRVKWKKKLNKNIVADVSIKIEENDTDPSNAILVANVQNDPRTRLALFTDTHVVVQFNGPILQFSECNPLHHESISRLGPDALKPDFDIEEAKKRLKKRIEMKLVDLLLDQTFVAGVGNKYKSEILFLLKASPFRLAKDLSSSEQEKLLQKIQEVLKAGYLNAGRTRPQRQGENGKWNFRHWVFRRAGRPCWICNTPVRMDRHSSSRVTFWCQYCQQK
jgi:formamidopyrimidine-DNA glycosylase